MSEIESSGEEDSTQDDDGGKKKITIRSVIDEVCPQLTLYRGRDKLSRRKSALVVGLLYVSHSFSAWGDRMWGYVVSLFLVILYPGSLLLPAIFGFLVQLSTAFFGTLVGDWVDSNPRMRVVWMSLLVQNSLVALCSIAIALMFALDWNVCQHVVIFACLIPVVIIFGSGANLATIANTISIEKDWIVVIADKNENTLAILNSNMRRIDLLCKLLAPVITGILLQQTGPLATTIIVALWNVVSFFGELFLVWMVYRLVPMLAVKKSRKHSTADNLLQSDDDSESQQLDNTEDTFKDKEDDGSDEKEDGDTESGDSVDIHPLPNTKQICPCCRGKTRKFFSRLLTPFITLINGWRIYMKQDIALIGFAMAAIYLTVLGFSGVTAAYFLTQGLRNDLIGLCQGIGAVFGVTGTVIYPFVRRRIGTVRTGLFGIGTQWTILLLCIVSVAVPSERISSQVEGYYSADCSGFLNNTDSTEITVNTSVSFSEPLCLASTAMVTTSNTNDHSVTATRWTPVATSSRLMQINTANLDRMVTSPINTFSIPVPLTTLSPMPSTTPVPNHFSSGQQKRRFARDFTMSSSSLPPGPCHRPLNTPPTTPPRVSGISIALIFMILGVVCCRVGLWIFDLSVQQLVQENVKEEERGVVSGVMNVMNSIMDMLHYVLVIAAPRPEHFRILTVISVGMVTLGLVLYAAYVRKVRGHFFHMMDFCRWTMRKIKERRARQGGSILMFAEKKDTSSFKKLVNDEGSEDEECELSKDDIILEHSHNIIMDKPD